MNKEKVMSETSKNENGSLNFKGIIKYISTVVSWTVFSLLMIIGALLLYYYISIQLYNRKGSQFEPKFSVYTIVSQSMEPTINVYDVIVNTNPKSIDDIKINDVVTFISTWEVNYGMTITHRVVGKNTLDDGTVCLVTRGDNNTTEDKSCVKEQEVIGVVKAVIPGLGKIQSFLGSSLGWLMVIIVPALFIIIKDILKIFKVSNSIKKENEIEVEEDNNKSKNKKLKNTYKDLTKAKKK